MDGAGVALSARGAIERAADGVEDGGKYKGIWAKGQPYI